MAAACRTLTEDGLDGGSVEVRHRPRPRQVERLQQPQAEHPSLGLLGEQQLHLKVRGGETEGINDWQG